jgi:hypothetical protein
VNTVTVLDLQSGGPRLVIDTDMDIMCLGVTEGTVVVVDKKKIITWNIPGYDSALDAPRANVDSIRTVKLDSSRRFKTSFGEHTMSLDLSRIARVDNFHLEIYNVSDGRRPRGFEPIFMENMIRLSPDGREVWSVSYLGRMRGWKITEGS